MAQGHLAASALAPATKVARKTQLKRYRKFCTKFNLKSFPCTPSQASIYATHLSDTLTPVSVRNYLSAVWYRQKMLGFTDYSENFILKQTLLGIERVFSAIGKPERYPLTAQDLLGIYSHLDLSLEDDRLFWLSAVISFRGLLRVCHTTQSPHNIRVGQVVVGESHTSLRILSSKTDQFGRAPFNVFLRHIPGSPLCVRSLIEGLIKGASSEAFLLSHSVQGISFPVGYTFVNSRLKALAFSLGLPVSRVSTHSFRHGGATLLKELGMPVSSVMLKGNWKSGAVYRYLHQSSRDFEVLEKAPCDYFSSLM